MSEENPAFEISQGNDMDESHQKDAILHFQNAIQQFETDQEIAKYIKTKIEEKYKGSWHCIVGRAFGSAVTYDEKSHFSKQFGPIQVELWKC